MKDEVLTPMMVNEKIKLDEKKIKVNNIQLRMIEDYIKKGDYSEPLNFVETAMKEKNEEFFLLKNEIGVKNTVNLIKAELNGAQERIHNNKILLKNPQLQKQGIK